MAGDGQSVDLDPFFNNSVEELDPKDPKEEAPTEEEELDTSEEESEEATEEEGEEEDDGDDDEEEPQTNVSDPKDRAARKAKRDDWKSRYDAAEEHRKQMQSERDMLRHQVNQQIESIRRIEDRLENLSTQKAEDTPGILGDDDSLLTVGQIKKLLSQQKAPPPQRQGPSATMSREESDWIYSQPDFDEVNKYANEKGLQYNPEFTSTKTNLVGRYQAVRALIAKEKAEEVERENKRLAQELKKLKKRVKPKVPSIGAGSHPASVGRGQKQGSEAADRFWGA